MFRNKRFLRPSFLYICLISPPLSNINPTPPITSHSSHLISHHLIYIPHSPYATLRHHTPLFHPHLHLSTRHYYPIATDPNKNPHPHLFAIGHQHTGLPTTNLTVLRRYSRVTCLHLPLWRSPPCTVQRKIWKIILAWLGALKVMSQPFWQFHRPAP